MKALLIVALLAATARADVQRYAVIVGNNAGLGDEQTLRHAETDAQHVSELLAELGGVPETNQIVLRGKTVDEVRNALIVINDRIRSRQRAGDLTVLHVYYSGHGDENALHLGRGRFGLRDLDELVHASPAEIKVLVIDACRSGAVTRPKGKPLAADLASALGGSGTIVLTASAAGEDAQESDEIGGSFFTHHFLSGLRGAADDDGDGVVTVDEAFRYTRDRTIATSSRTFSGTQHPMFHYDVRGRGDVVLSEVNRRERGTLTVPAGATWLAFGNGVVSEIDADAKRRSLSLRPGNYRVRGLTRDALLEGTVTVTENRETLVDTSKLARSMYARLVRKGRGRYLRTATGPIVALSSVNVIGYGGAVGWSFARPNVTISPRVLGWRLVDDNQTTSVYGGSLRITRAWELDRFSIDFGIELGATHATDDTDSPLFPVATDKYRAVHGVACIGITVPITQRTYIGGELGWGVFIPFSRVQNESPHLTFNLVAGTWL